MKLKRELNTTDATYDILGLTHGEFRQIATALEHFCYYTQLGTDDPLVVKFREMTHSSVTII